MSNWLKESIHNLLYFDKQKKTAIEIKRLGTDEFDYFWNEQIKKLRHDENIWKNYCIEMLSTALDIDENQIDLSYNHDEKYFNFSIPSDFDHSTLAIFPLLNTIPKIIETKNNMIIKVI